MILHAVRVRNFFSVVDATIDYRGTGTTLVVGRTGSGKSALFVEPLLWVFYGSLNRTDLASYSNRVGRRYRGKPVEEPTQVEVWFSQAGSEFYVRKSLDRGYEISKDGQPITPYLQKSDGLAAVQKIIRLPENLFRSIAVMGQGFRERFSGFKDSSRSEVLEDFLGAAVFEEAKARTDNHLSIVETFRSAAVAQLSSLQASLTATRGQIESVRASLNTLSATNAAIRNDLLEEQRTLQSQLSQFALESESFQQQLVNCDRQALSLMTAQGELQSEVDRLQTAVGGYRATLDSTKRDYSLLNSLSGICSLCGQVVDEAHRRQELHRLQSACEISQQSLQQSMTMLYEKKTAVASLSGSQAEVTRQCSMLNQSLMGLQVQEARHKSRLREIDANLQSLDQSESQALVFLGSLESRLQEEQLKEQSLTASLQRYEEHRSLLAWWSEGFSIRGLRSARLTSAIDTLNLDLAKYAQLLFEGQLQVRLLPVKMQKTAAAKPVVTVEVIGPSGCYELASGGQDRGIDLAIHLALRAFAKKSANGWSSNFLIGDEIFDQLDADLTHRALGVIKFEADRVFLCTHSLALQALCDSVIRVRYEDEQTRL